jgi:hypothetical protein
MQNIYCRLNLSLKEFEVLDLYVSSLIDEIKETDGDYSNDKLEDIEVLKNILNNVKHIKVSNEKSSATKNANKSKIDKSREKIKHAYEVLKKENKKITIYSIRNEAKVSLTTAEKHKDIFEDDLN